MEQISSGSSSSLQTVHKLPCPLHHSDGKVGRPIDLSKYASTDPEKQAVRPEVRDDAESIYPKLTFDTLCIVQIAKQEAYRAGDTRVTASHLLLAIAKCRDTDAAKLLAEKGITLRDVRNLYDPCPDYTREPA